MAAIQLSFALRVSSSVKTVHLLGSWDNYAGQLPLAKDKTSSKSGSWKGTFRFQGTTLQPGQRYWYYYIIDGYHVSHDPAVSSTTEPTTGRVLNILDVPVEKSSSRSSKSSSSSSKHSSVHHHPDTPPAQSHHTPLPAENPIATHISALTFLREDPSLSLRSNLPSPCLHTPPSTSSKPTMPLVQPSTNSPHASVLPTWKITKTTTTIFQAHHLRPSVPPFPIPVVPAHHLLLRAWAIIHPAPTHHRARVNDMESREREIESSWTVGDPDADTATRNPVAPRTRSNTRDPRAETESLSVDEWTANNLPDWKPNTTPIRCYRSSTKREKAIFATRSNLHLMHTSRQVWYLSRCCVPTASQIHGAKEKKTKRNSRFISRFSCTSFFLNAVLIVCSVCFSFTKE